MSSLKQAFSDLRAVMTDDSETTQVDGDLPFDLMKDVFGPIDASQYYTYQGSLTTPGCNEGITWFNMANPLYLSPAQLLEFTLTLAQEQGGVSRGGDNRLIQPLNGRPVYKSF